MVKDQQSRRSYHKLCCFHGHQTFEATTNLSRIPSYKDLRPYANEGISRKNKRKAGLGCEILCQLHNESDIKYHFSTFGFSAICTVFPI